VGAWHFSWGYSTKHLSQPPFGGLALQPNHDYELGIRFTGSVVELYVLDVATSTIYVMGTVSDTGHMYVTYDQPGFIIEGFTTQISEMNVSAFKAYMFNVFLSPSSSTEWPHAVVTNQNTPPSQIHTYDLGGHQYLIGYTSQGQQRPDGYTL
jgi:hypothetical protein